MLNREKQERLLKQHSFAVWFTGLSGAGKTTIACHLEKKIYDLGYLTRILDGDLLRSGINKDLSFKQSDRFENIRRIAEISKLFIDTGVITLNSFISPTKDMRQMARDIIGKNNFIEVFVDAPLHICEKRDVKGLYKKARKGEIALFTGIHSPYEIPENPDIKLNTDIQSIDESVEVCLKYIAGKIPFYP